ncbi:MAG: Rrf2 family transcriptional regulator [Bacteroidales bacterium]|nr:Rrf2 family transcriptional regulator [Bacteroidales bacterium]
MNKVVNLSEASSLAIHAMVLIAKSDKQINVSQIADLMGSSRNHLAKVMQRLVKEGFVKSLRGPSGGFTMQQKPEDITLLQIFECIEGPIQPTGCPLDRQVCPFDKCLMGGIVTDTTIQIREYFQSHTLADMLQH